MSTFEEIMDNTFTSDEEVRMVSSARIGAEQDITAEAARIPAYADVLLQQHSWARNTYRKYPQR